MTPNNLPKPIMNALLDEANRDDNYEPVPNSYHITDLVGCLRKAYYKKTQPKIKVNLESAINFHRGKLWDKDFTSLFRHNQIRVTYRCKHTPISISGHLDFIDTTDPAEPVVTDLKSPKTLFYVEREGKPNEHYRKQVLFYCFCTAINRGRVAYWDGCKYLPFDIEVSNTTVNQLIGELETKTNALYNALQNKSPPGKAVSSPEPWECRLCDYKATCQKETPQ